MSVCCPWRHIYDSVIAAYNFSKLELTFCNDYKCLDEPKDKDWVFMALTLHNTKQVSQHGDLSEILFQHKD